MQYLNGAVCRVVDLVTSEHNIVEYRQKYKLCQKAITLEAPKSYKYDFIGMASIYAYTHIASPPPALCPFNVLGKRMDLSLGNPRDQILSLLSSLSVNVTASGVSPRAGTHTGGNSVTAQVHLTQNQVMSCLLSEPDC